MDDDRWGEEIERLRRSDVPIVHVPLPQRIEREEPSASAAAGAASAADDADRVPWPAIVGALALAVLACIPHLVAPSVALLVAIIAAPLSWGMQRITSGRRRRAYLALAGTFVLVAALAVAAPVIWVELGVMRWPTLPTG